MANKSSYGRNLICFNPMKPTGKFHFKIYMICCAKTNLTIRMKIHTKDFYSCLISNNFGLQHVSQWIQNRRVDLFSKQIIMFPINLDKHWSLMVACYPGAVSDTDCAPIMLHLDSLRLHNGRIIAEKLRSFFNWEWSKKKGQSIGDIFTDVTYPVFSPDGM